MTDRGHAESADPDDPPPFAYLAAATFVSAACLFGVWIALVGQADVQDDMAGLGVAVVGAGFGWLVSRRGRAVPQLHLSDVRPLMLLIPQLVTQTAGIYASTWRRIRGRGRPSGYRLVPTDVAGGGWRSARRSGIVVALLSFTPDTVVIDIDAETGVATVHDFVARRGDR